MFCILFKVPATSGPSHAHVEITTANNGEPPSNVAEASTSQDAKAAEPVYAVSSKMKRKAYIPLDKPSIAPKPMDIEWKVMDTIKNIPVYFVK